MFHNIFSCFPLLCFHFLNNIFDISRVFHVPEFFIIFRVFDKFEFLDYGDIFNYFNVFHICKIFIPIFDNFIILCSLIS